ncbi:ABC transporter ATP-binding protein [Streptomyces sp. NPDC091281]|uniref:ABC transporter ATP-binding protein n=1 Tax=Streptomyces sp. NPDC091281 TaxID=3365985 RepID=UPI003808BA27
MTTAMTATALPVASGRATLAHLARTARRHPRDCAAALGWTVAAGVCGVLVPLLLGRLVDAVRDGRHADLAGLLVLTALAALVGAGCTAAAQRATVVLGARIAALLREDVVARVLALDPRTAEAAGGGEVTSRVTEDMENFTTAVPLLAEVVTAGGTVAVSLAAFGSLDWRLALAFLTVVPVYVLGLHAHLPRAARRYAEERAAAAERGRVVLESLHGARTVDAYDMAALQTGRVDAASGRALTAGLRATWLSLWLAKSMNAAEAVGLCAILLTGSLLVDGGEVTVGAVAAAGLLFHRLFDPLGTLLTSFDQVQRAGAALARIVGVAALPAPAPVPVRRPSGPVAVEARGLRFSYGPGHGDVLHGVDLVVPPGTSLAVVGASGAGKTTLAHLVAGLLAPSRGRAVFTDRVGPVDVREVGDEDRPAWTGVIAQEPHVFTGTLRDDLTLAAPGADDAAVHAALDAVGARWAAALPDGLDTRIGVGGHPLDAAQAQQLALARIALADPPVVVLDEATAEAGSAHARVLEDAAHALVRGRTALVVAHRLSQARRCDRIAVLADGRVAELGTHTGLLALRGRYAALWSAWTEHGAPERGPVGASEG